MVEEIPSNKGNIQSSKNSQQFPLQPIQLTKDNANIELYKNNCRCCLLQKGELNIFKTTVENIKLSHMINCICNEKISGTDGLSKKLCEKCLRSIIDVYIFTQRFKTNQEFLKKLVGKTKETENSDIVEVNDIPDDGLQGFVQEFEKENNEIDEFKRKFRSIGPIYKELCEVMIKNRKQLMRLNPSELAKAKVKREENLKKKEQEKAVDENSTAEPADDTGENLIQLAANAQRDAMLDFENEDDETEEAIKSISNVNEKSMTVDDLLNLCTSNEVFTTEEADKSTKYEVYTLPSDLSEENLKKFASVKLFTKTQEEEEDPNLVMLAAVPQCFQCLTVFKTMVDLSKHSLETGHVIPPRYKCRICSKTFKSKRGYKNHKWFHQKEAFQDVLCDICGTTVRQTNLKRHIMSAHKEGFMCSTCGKSFSQKGTLDHHIKIAHRGGYTNKSLCQFCGKLIYNALYHTHINDKHKEEKTCLPYKCDECDRYFTIEKALLLHKRIHDGKQVGFHNYRTKMAKNKGGAIETAEKKSGPLTKSNCPICLKPISTPNLYLHLQVHKGVKKYQCEVCLKKFRQMPHLKSHMNIHLGLKPYECKECGKKFRHKTTLVTHERSHTGETPYVCPVCQRGFVHLTAMKKHTQIHFKTNNVRQQVRQNVRSNSYLRMEKKRAMEYVKKEKYNIEEESSDDDDYSSSS